MLACPMLHSHCGSYWLRFFVSFRIAGKAAYYLGEYVSAVDHFRSAIELNGQVLPAWEGLAFTQIALGEIEKAIETYQKLVSVLSFMIVPRVG
jgi:tetratricopeptide (TPR) repeat protein